MKKILKTKKLYIIVGIFIILISCVTLFAFSKSYALEGFGQLNLICDKEIGIPGENITCNITGTVASTSQVSSLSSQIKLSNNLELINFTTASIWEGIGDNGNIQLYTANNKTDTFEIGTFTIKIKEGIINTTETITLEDSYFYDNNFEEQSIKDSSFQIKTPQVSSTKYDFSKDYIISDTKDIETIINNIQTEKCSVVIDNNGTSTITGSIKEGSKLVVKNENNILKEFAIIYMNSTKYDLSKNYIISSISDLTNIMNDIEVMNGSLSIKNEQLVLSYQNIGIVHYDILNLYSENYKIDLNKKYIMINHEINNSILDSISKSSNVSLTIDGTQLKINYLENTIATLNILKLYSDKYDINLNKGYINLKNNSISNSIIDNITTDISLSFSNNKVIGKYNDVSILELKLVSISTEEYYIDSNFNYIYTKYDKEIDEIESNLNIINGSIEIADNKLNLIYQGEVISQLEHTYFSTTYKITNDKLYIKEATPITTFINDITLSGISYKIYNSSNQEITTGNIEDNYIIKLFKNSTLVDTYTIKIAYLEINNLKVDEEKQIMYQLPLNMTYNDLLKNIVTSGSINVEDENGNQIELSNKIKSYDVVNITIGNENYNYKVSVFGDVAGGGTITVGDVAKLYQGLKGKIKLDDIATLAGDVTKDNEIKINDIAKLYSYLKGKITSLD